MKSKFNSRFFSLFLVLTMILSLFSPIQVASANELKPFKPTTQSESTMQLKAAIADQLNVLDGGPQLHKELQGLSGNQEVDVIIHLSEKPVALEKGIQNLSGKAFSSSQENQARTKVLNQQNFVLKEIALKNINIQLGYSFDTVLNGFSATVKADDLDKLLTVQGIALVEPDTIVHASEEKPLKTKPTTPSNPLKNTQVEAMMNTSISFLGIEKLWNEGIEGQGIKVAVLDTGIDADHPEFAGIYKGGKNFIPNSSSYTKNRADDDASETSPVERPAHMPEINDRGNSFYTSHGTHVAGTIAAIGANEYGIKGIAPKVDLYAYRVLGAYGSGATSGIVRAIETAVIEKMDVINLSLGGGANTETDSGSFAINNAMMAGTISVIATGNEGPNRGTMGTPSTARLGIAVGNTTNPEEMHNGQVNVTAGDYNLSKQLQLMGTTFGKDLATQLQGEFEIVAVPGNGEAKDYTGIDVSGKVALISRGSIAFVDKIAHAKDNGAVATIIHNFAGGTNAPNASGTFLGDSFAFLPTFDLSQTDGDAIRAALKQGSGKVTFGNFSSTKTIGDEVNDSSSRGPSTPNFDIKPDVTAPGTNIMSTIPMYKADFPDAVYSEAYDRKTGTSMATPHIAGIAALVKQANPSWNAFDVKVALSNTAKLLDKTKYDVFAQGAGRVDAYAAARPDVLAYAVDQAVLDSSGTIVENLKGTVTFGPQKLSEDISVTKQILVKDFKGNGGNYNVTVDVTKSFGDASVTVDKSSFTLAGEELLNVTLTASNATAPKGSEILGYIHINGAHSTVSLPFAADFSEVSSTTEVTNMAITATDLSFNGDGVKDSALLSFTITGDVATNYIELWDIMNPDGGEYGDGYIGYLHAANSLGKGSYTLNVNGQYRPWGGTTVAKIPDGLYTIDFTAQAATGVIGDYVGPVVVKTTKPEITGSVAEKIATGKVVDKYLEYNEELYLYGLDFDLNDKLHASYIPTIGGKEADAVPFDLAQDGTFTFPVTDETEAVKVIVKDEAGNVGEALIYEKEEPEAEVTLSVNPSNLKLKTGEKGQVTVTETTTPEKGDPTNKDVTAEATYVMADESVATVANGEVTAVAPGSTTITITHGKNEVKVNVIVEDPAVIVPGVSLTANKTEFNLEKGKEAQLVIKEVTTAADGSSKQKDVTKAATYKVADTKVASVKNGLITAKNAGTTTINVKYGKNELTVNVAVTESVVTLTANKTEIDLELGKEAQLAIKEVTTAADGTSKQKDVTTAASYKVADTKVVSVKNGLIISKNIGSTEITVKYGKNELTVYVTVSEKGVTLTTNKTDITLESGKESQLKIIEETTAANGAIKKTDVTKQATYEVADANVATVKNGLVTAKEAGSTTILVKYGKNELTVNVTVIKPTVTLTANKTQLDLEPQKEAQLVIKEVVTGADGKAKQTDVTNFAEYKVANTKVTSVSKTGLVRAKNEGNTTVTVKYGGNELTVDVNVIVPVVTLEVDKTHVELVAGKEANLKVKEITTTADGNQTERNVTQNATYKVDDRNVATVKEGKITAKAAGETAVTVKYGKNEVVVNVIVKEPKVEISVDQTQLNLLAGDEAQLTVKEITTSVDGDVKGRDVTTAAKYKVADGKVVAVSEGKVRAKAAGTTQITVVYNKMEVTVDVTVSQPEVVLVANLTDINLNLNQQAQLYISEMTTMPDGTVFERDVTQAVNYIVADRKIVTVSNGLVSPRKTEGSTTITVKYGKMELVVNVNVGNFVKMDSPYIFDNPLFNETLLNEELILTEEIVIPTMPTLDDSMLNSGITPIEI